MDPGKANQLARLCTRKLIEGLRKSGILPAEADTQAAAEHGVGVIAKALLAADQEGYKRGQAER